MYHEFIKIKKEDIPNRFNKGSGYEYIDGNRLCRGVQ